MSLIDKYKKLLVTNEAKEDITALMNKLIAAETGAIWSYFMLSKTVKGPLYEDMTEIFENHMEEEEGHRKILIQACKSNYIDINSNLTTLISLSPDDYLPATITNIPAALTFAKESEARAIFAYRNAYNVLQNTYPAIANYILDILSQEQEHFEELDYFGVAPITR